MVMQCHRLSGNLDMEARYQPIENYGIIGNMRTVALVGMDGSIDWLCLPHFDSPSVFAAILDDRKGGRFRVAPVSKDIRYKQFYWPSTNILVTRFLHADGVGEVEDYMPIGGVSTAPDQLIRRVRVVRGTMPFHLECRPRFNYARSTHETHLDELGACFRGQDFSLGLAAPVRLQQDEDGVVADFVLKEGEKATFVLRILDPKEQHRRCPGLDEAEELFRVTVEYWRRWLSRCTYHGRWREIVQRSALTLKLLSFEPTGAIVAAPTCSLPEAIGGVRNWDYRYTWIRDAAFTVYGLLASALPRKPRNSEIGCRTVGTMQTATRTDPCNSCMALTAAPISPRNARPFGRLSRFTPSSNRKCGPPATPARHLRRTDGCSLSTQQIC